MSRARVLAAAVLASTLAAPTARADDTATVWGRARRPDLVANEKMLRQVDEHLRNGVDVLPDVRELYMREARRQLEAAGGDRSTDVRVRVRYADVLHMLDDYAGCARAYERVLAASPDAPTAAHANDGLAICYAHLGRHVDEMRAYGAALELEARPDYRARLFANRAEALMALGDIEGAIRGYRDSVSLVAGMGPPTDKGLATTYWGLGVALDRGGNLEAGLAAIAIARAYDRSDSAISDANEWFFSPVWDGAWYFALGHWQHARAAKLTAARVEHYLSAVALWEEYLAKAPADDRY
ncbi:MAG TPA: hypothetical protein VGM56_02460, partial [Byssovorax sp.]